MTFLGFLELEIEYIFSDFIDPCIDYSTMNIFSAHSCGIINFDGRFTYKTDENADKDVPAIELWGEKMSMSKGSKHTLVYMPIGGDNHA